MKSFAELDENNLVIRCIVADSLFWCENNLGGVWVVNPKNDPMKNTARIGWTYDEERDAFIPPKPFESWVLDEATCLWVAPVPYPEDGESYTWDEDLTDWVEVINDQTV
jgi:hypothetical protein